MYQSNEIDIFAIFEQKSSKFGKRNKKREGDSDMEVTYFSPILARSHFISIKIKTWSPLLHGGDVNIENNHKNFSLERSQMISISNPPPPHHFRFFINGAFISTLHSNDVFFFFDFSNISVPVNFKNPVILMNHDDRLGE